MRMLIAAAAALALTACFQNAPEDEGDPEITEVAETEAATDETDEPAEGEEVAAADPEEDAEEVATPEPAPAPEKSNGWQRITIAGFECGDNCYLLYTRSGGGEEESALCSVGPCEDWYGYQEMPANMIGRRARVKFGTGSQVDGSGNVMSDDFTEITALELR